MSANAASILVKKLGKSATLTLNRPKALNALNSEMCNIVKQSLNLWNKNMNQTDVKVDTSLLPADAPEKVTSFLMNSSSEKAFCAGGDVRQLWDDCMDATKTDTLGLGHRDRISANFFVEEYEMNYMLGTSTIPQVSVWNGITMGGGVGISVLGDFRIATEKTLFAMPETAIGLFPDVGSSAWLPHLAPGVGEYIGLTGVRLGPGDLVFTGIATHYIPSSKLGELEQKIAESQADSTDESRKELRSILKTISESPPITPEEIEAAGSGRNHTNIIRNNIDTISECFANKSSVHEIMDALKVKAVGDATNVGCQFSSKTLETLNKMSPTSLKLTFQQLKRGKKLDLKGCLEMEFRMTQGCMKGHDFKEGIRAVLVDKDGSPKWDPATVDEVSDEVIDEYFHDLGEFDLNLQNNEDEQ